MTHLGISAMLHILCGGNRNDPAKYTGRKITAASVTDDKLHISFNDGVSIVLSDDGQSCCEHRYMTCDDDPSTLVGHNLIWIKANTGPSNSTDDYGGEHETCFVEVATSGGFITLTTHNVHNGYYGGFALNITETSDANINQG